LIVMGVALGIDIGTSGTKTLAIDERGNVLASASAEYPCSYPRPGWSEQDPELWWRATVETVKGVLAQGKFSASDVTGIGLSGQMHGSVFLDGAGKVIRPALLWNDQRTAAECEEIERRAGGKAELTKMVANIALTGFTAPKLLWLRNHEPENWERVRQVLLPKDYVRYRLTGTYATEVSDASGTLLLDVANRRWSLDLLAKLDLDSELLPPATSRPRFPGRSRRWARRRPGWPRGLRWSAAAATSRPGRSATGSSAPGWSRPRWGPPASSSPTPSSRGHDPLGRLQRGCHAVPGAYYIMGVVLAAGGSFQWLRNELGQAEVEAARAKGVDPYAILSEQAASAPAGSEGLVFLPYLTGERAPHFDPEARGGWIGLTVRHGRPHLIRSVLEGATYAMRDCLELIREAGTEIDQVRLSGGGARGDLWRQIQADIYGCEATTIHSSEGPALGVAILAHVGTGAYATVPEACDAIIRLDRRIAPQPGPKAAYDRGYGVYRGLYPALKDSMHALSDLAKGI
jgi:xylulokinase